MRLYPLVADLVALVQALGKQELSAFRRFAAEAPPKVDLLAAPLQSRVKPSLGPQFQFAGPRRCIIDDQEYASLGLHGQPGNGEDLIQRSLQLLVKRDVFH